MSRRKAVLAVLQSNSTTFQSIFAIIFNKSKNQNKVRQSASCWFPPRDGKRSFKLTKNASGKTTNSETCTKGPTRREQVEIPNSWITFLIFEHKFPQEASTQTKKAPEARCP